MLQLNLGAFDFPFLLIVFLHPLQKAVSALRILGVLSLHINSLGKNLALNLLVHSDAHGMLGDTRKLFWFCCGDTYGPSFLYSIHFLDVYNITFLVDSYVYGQWNNSMLPKRPREHTVGAPPFSLVFVIWTSY